MSSAGPGIVSANVLISVLAGPRIALFHKMDGNELRSLPVPFAEMQRWPNHESDAVVCGLSLHTARTRARPTSDATINAALLIDHGPSEPVATGRTLGDLHRRELLAQSRDLTGSLDHSRCHRYY